jgi:hypothetical protein
LPENVIGPAITEEPAEAAKRLAAIRRGSIMIGICLE